MLYHLLYRQTVLLIFIYVGYMEPYPFRALCYPAS